MRFAYSTTTLLLILLAGAYPLAGQGKPQVDLSLEIDRVNAITRPGSSGSFILIVANHGPDIAGTLPPDTVGSISVLAGPQFVSPGFRVPVELFLISGDLGCGPFLTLIGEPEPGDIQIQISYLLAVKSLLPGESLSCTIGFTINPSHVVDIVNRWEVISTNDAEVNVTNNDVEIVFQLGLNPTEIPTLSTFGLTLLGLAIGVSYLVIRRRNRPA